MRSDQESISIYDKAVNPKDVLATVKGEFGSKMMIRERSKKQADEARQAKAQAEDDKLRQKRVDGMIANIANAPSGNATAAAIKSRGGEDTGKTVVGFADEARVDVEIGAKAAPPPAREKDDISVSSKGSTKLTFDDLKD